jgi:hypothetical protein
MTTQTLGELAGRHGFAVLEHLEAEAEVPVVGGLQAQGDLLIIPVSSYRVSGERAEVAAAGLAVIAAVGSGHEHRLFAGAPGTAWFTAGAHQGMADIGVLQCTGPAYVLHPEHGAAGIAAGTYVLRRQREQADEERLVAD